MATFRGITFVEHIPGSPMEILENDGARTTRVLDCAWTDRQTFADKLLGYPSVKTGSVGGTSPKYISRTTPAYDPDFLNAQGNPWLFATRIQKVEGIAFNDKSKNDTSEYDTARLTVLYESLTYEVAEDSEVMQGGVPDESQLKRFVTILYRPYSEFVTGPRGQLKWSTDGVGVPFGVPQLISTFQIDFIWHLVPRVNAPILNISQAMGTVNNAAFVTPVGTFGTETLLLMTADIKPVRSALGDRLVDIHYHAKFFSPLLADGVSYGGHNYFLRPKAGSPPTVAWELATRDGTTGSLQGNRLYMQSDFTKLFKPV